jgi:hypothetical protein
MQLMLFCNAKIAHTLLLCFVPFQAQLVTSRQHDIQRCKQAEDPRWPPV